MGLRAMIVPQVRRTVESGRNAPIFSFREQKPTFHHTRCSLIACLSFARLALA
jgi:hypothetical protein